MNQIDISTKSFPNKFALVDKEDFEYLNQWKWSFSSHGYAMRTQWVAGGKGKTIKFYLHRVVMGNPKGKTIDHINRSTLDCRKSNLRTCTHAENLSNRGKNKNNTSGFKGVRFDEIRKKWVVTIKSNYKTFLLGRFDCLGKALKAHSLGVKKHHGNFGYFNKLNILT